MKDFAVRIWDSKNKEMVIVTDLTMNTFYKLHTGENKEDPMLGSPFCDVKGNRLFENDIIIERNDDDIRYDTIKFDCNKGWVLEDCINSSRWKLREFIIERSFWDDEKPEFENSIKYERVANIYTHPNLIADSIKEYDEKKEAEKREKELSCLMKLKAKYDGVEA